MITNPRTPSGSTIRLVADAVSEIEITPLADWLAVVPSVSQRSTFPKDPFDTEGVFIAPEAGFYLFRSSAEIQGGGKLLVSVWDIARDQRYTGQAQGDFESLVAVVEIELYLEAGDGVRPRDLLYQALAPASLWKRPDSNFCQIRFLGA